MLFLGNYFHLWSSWEPSHSAHWRSVTASVLPDLVSVSPQQGQSLHVHFEIFFGSQKWNQSGFVGDSREGEKLREAALSSCAAVFMSDLQELFPGRQEEPGSGRSRVNMAKRDPCSTISHWELPSCSSPELSRGKFKSWAEFASVRSSVLLQPSLFKGV